MQCSVCLSNICRSFAFISDEGDVNSIDEVVSFRFVVLKYSVDKTRGKFIRSGR